MFYKTETSLDNASTAVDEKFVKVKKGESIRVRQLPAMNESGKTMFKQVLHYKMKDPDSEDGKKGIALGCGKYHGDGTCLICDVVDFFSRSNDPNEVKLTKYPDGIHAGTSFYTPVLVATKGAKGWNHSDPKLFRLAPSGAAGLTGINSQLQANDLPLVNDPEAGQDVIVTCPSGPGEYKVMTTSLQVPLLDIKPDIENKLMPDVEKILDTKVWSEEKVEETLRHSLPQIDWDAVLAEVRGD